MIQDDKEAKIQWYLNYAEPTEFNSEEVDKLISKETINIECLELNSESNVIVMPEQKKPSRTKAIISISGLVAAAAILTLTIIGINNKPLRADPDTGFLHFLKDDETGKTLITNPQAAKKSSGQQLPSTITKSYEFIGEPVHIEDTEFFITLKSIFYIPKELPDEMKLMSFESSRLPEKEYFYSHYENNFKIDDDPDIYHFINIGIDADTEISHRYMLMQSKELSGIEVFYYQSQSETSMLVFGDGVVIYYVTGNIEIDYLEKIMKDYVSFLQDNNVI